MSVRTIFLMAEDCAKGEPTGWYEFVRDYAPIARRLLLHYFPSLSPEIDAHILGVLEKAHADNNAWFHGQKFVNEREFLMLFRELVFPYARASVRIPVPEISLDQMREIMKDLNVFEREVLWLFVKGYTAEQISPMMQNAEATAKAVKEIADQRLTQILPGATAAAFNVSARVLMEAAETTKTENCLPLRTFNNIINGQVSWREREVAEQHIRDCFNCIDRTTAFSEMIRLRKDEKPLPEDQVQRILDSLHVDPPKRKGMLSRLFAKT